MGKAARRWGSHRLDAAGQAGSARCRQTRSFPLRGAERHFPQGARANVRLMACILKTCLGEAASPASAYRSVIRSGLMQLTCSTAKRS